MNNENTASTASDFQEFQYCQYRLPCGICTRTNSMCPLITNTPTITLTANGPSD